MLAPCLWGVIAGTVYFTLGEILAVFFFGALCLYFLGAIRVRELAVQAVGRASRQDDFQLLDQTVHIRRISLSRDETGPNRGASGLHGTLLTARPPERQTVVCDSQHIGLLDRGQRLFGHLCVDTVLVTADTPGINNHKRAASNFCLTVFTVTGKSREVCDQRITAAGKLVKRVDLPTLGNPTVQPLRRRLKADW